MSAGGRSVLISGIGQSDVGRKLHRTDLELTAKSCLAAIDDAGLTRDDIDGLVTFPGPINLVPGQAGPGVNSVQAALRLRLNYYSSGLEVAGQLGALLSAANAILAGQARHVLVYRTWTESSAQTLRGRAGFDETGLEQAPWLRWAMPHNIMSIACMIALQAQRHMHLYGLRREHMGAIAVHNRNMAALNPKAIYREPLSMDQYLNARMISTPLSLYDCDVPCDGSIAFVLSAEEFSDELVRSVRIHAIGGASYAGPFWEYGADLDASTITSAAESMWARTDLQPADVDVAQVYDGFTFLTVAWLEALFCGTGNGGDFIGDGHRFAIDGELPMNTDGGQLSAGRTHGFGKVFESVLQLRGEAGARQVDNAQVALAAAGGTVGAASMLLTR